MAYMNQERKAALAVGIKRVLAKYGMKGSIAVDHHSTLAVTLTGGPLDILGQLNAYLKKEFELRGYGTESAGTYTRVNEYHIDNTYDGKVAAFLNELKTAMNKSECGTVTNHNNSDPMSDYYDVGWYIDISVGRWNKPYKYTGAALAPADTVQALKCGCCGVTTKGSQWHGAETGKGVCAKCAAWLVEHGEDVGALFGEAGHNYGLTDDPPRAAPVASESAPAVTVAETTHTVRGHALWVAQFAERVSREAFDAALTRAKELNGYYSSFAKNGAIPGFIFRDASDASKFAGGFTHA